MRRTSELVELTDDIRIEVRSASGRKLRGPRFIGITADELAHWLTEEYLQDPDVAILNGARPGMLTVRSAGWGMVTMASSPHIRRGELWNMFDKYYGKDDPNYLVARGTTREFNPTIPQEEIDRELARDPATNKAEYLAQFRDDLEEYVSRAAVEACISPAYIDEALGVRHNIFCLHRSGNRQRPQLLYVMHRARGERQRHCY